MLRKLLLTGIFCCLVSELISQFPAAEIIQYKTSCVLEHGNLVTEVSCLIQINSIQGEIFSDINIDYQKGEKLKILEARLEDLYGNPIRNIKENEIFEKNKYTGSYYTDFMTRSFSLKHNKYPYRIFYHFVKSSDSFIYITDWNPTLGNIPVKNAELIVEFPENVNVMILEEKINHYTSTIENKTKLTWHSSNFKMIRKEQWAVPFLDGILPHVRVIPVSFFYGMAGNQSTWKEFGKWVYDLNENLDNLPENEKKRLDALIQSVDDTYEKIEILYKDHQDRNQYRNIALGTGGYKCFPASYVVENGYGDCKALCNYMKAVLKYAGIESNLALVYSGQAINKIEKNFTSSQFNHVILCVPGIKNDTVWLECTSKCNPVGYLGAKTQGRYALVISENDSKLVLTPSLYKSDVTRIENWEVNVDTSEISEMRVLINLKGDDFDHACNLIQLYDNKSLENQIRTYFYFGDFSITEWSLERESSSSDQINLQANLTVNMFQKNFNDYIVASVIKMDIPYIKDPQQRLYPVRINYPIHKKQELSYHLNDHLTIYNVPKDTIIDDKYGMYRFQSKKTNSHYNIQKEFILYKGDISLSDYSGF